MLAVQPTNALDELPLRAQLAFAARCARRVINLFRLPSNHPEFARCCRSLGAGIRLAESFAAGIDVDAEELAETEAGAVGAVTASSEMHPPNERAAYAANAAYAALCAVKAAVEFQEADSPGAGPARAAEAVRLARDAATAADDSVARMARLDWESLGRMCLGRFPDFGEPVDAGENGALGPLFQDLSRGVRSDSQATLAGAVDRSRSSTSAAGGARRHFPTEMAGTPSTGVRTQQNAEFESLRKQIEVDRRQFQADRAAFDAEKQSLQIQLFKELAKLDRERQRLQSNQQAIECQVAPAESSESETASRRAELEAREQELAAHCAAVDSREHELQAQQSELEAREDELASHLAEIELRAIQLEAEKNATRAAFEALGEERREFLEQRLNWMTPSTQS